MNNSSLEINSKKIQSQNRLIYIRQRNFKLPLLRNEKRKYFANLNEKDIIYNRKFWHTVSQVDENAVPEEARTLSLCDGEHWSLMG